MKRAKLFFILVSLTITTNAGYAQSNGRLSSGGGTTGANPHAISLYNLGLNAYKQGSPESAIIFFKRAVDLDPDLADAQYNLGVLYQSEHRLKEAVPRFKEALRVKPDDADSHYQLGLALIDLNQISEARQNLMAIAPNNSHFGDAQKKLATLDNQSMQNTVSQPVNGQAISNQPPITQEMPTNPTYNTPTGAAGQTYQTTTTTETVAANVPTNMQSTTNGTNGMANNNFSNNNLTVLLPNASIQIFASGFGAPSGLTFDHQGNLYIANFATNTIDRIRPDGSRSQFSTGINLNGPIGLVSDENNNLYVANYKGGTVTKINAAGIAQIIASGLKKPYYLSMDKEGNLFVSQQEDNSVVRISFARGNSTTDITSKAGQ